MNPFPFKFHNKYIFLNCDVRIYLLQLGMKYQSQQQRIGEHEKYAHMSMFLMFVVSESDKDSVWKLC